MEVTIRDIVESDYPAVEALIRQLHGFHAALRPDVFTPAFTYDREGEFLPCLAANGGMALLALVEGRPVGACMGCVRDREDGTLGRYRECHISDLVVETAFRRQGIAAALMARAEERAMALGAERVSLTLWRFNAGARSLYEELGYEELWSWMEKKL